LNDTGKQANKNNDGCYLRWSRIRKSVKVQEDNSGLMRSSISTTAVPSTPEPSSSSHHKIILNNVSGSAYPGEVLALMGPSGSGKTSLLDALSGRGAYEAGMLSINGTEAKGSVMKRFKRKVAYVKQADLFFGHLTVRDQVGTVYSSRYLVFTGMLALPKFVV